jgi:hypothetical protein
MRLFIWLEARSELKSGYGVRNHRCRVNFDDGNELGSIKWDAALWSMAAVLVAAIVFVAWL